MAPMSAEHGALEAQGADPGAALHSRADLYDWIHDRLSLPAETEQALLGAIDHVLLHYERVWRESKDEAVRAVATGSAQLCTRMRDELEARDVTSRNVALYFERIVTDLTERTHRDVKTQLLNFRHFMEHVALCLNAERQGPWCALGVADITSFKAHNDTLGHAAGDRIIEAVARLLRSEVRSSDRIAHPQHEGETTPPLHARFGGDEFCFFLSDLEQAATAQTVASRFWKAVARYDWSTTDPRLRRMAVNVDIGVACLHLGEVSKRHDGAQGLAEELFARADKRLYAVKRSKAPGPRISCEWLRIDGERLVDVVAT
jgi:diguanylate cyclase (GGDEF)-like protein